MGHNSNSQNHKKSKKELFITYGAWRLKGELNESMNDCLTYTAWLTG